MTIPATLAAIEPVYSGTHEVERTLFHILEAPEVFIAFGQEAEQLAHTPCGTHVRIGASSRVTLTSHEQAILVDRIEPDA